VRISEDRGGKPPVAAWAGREPAILAVLAAAALVASGLDPRDRLTWLLEVSWVLVGIPTLVLTRRRFPLTPLLYRLLFLHALVLILGGHYTYEHVPLGEWAQAMFGFQRNPYDRFGHFVQGFVPAILAREILLRCSPLRRGGWLFLLVVAVCLAFSAFFEMIEWWAALAYGAAADAFLATQGDPWDTQWDMFLAMVGSICSQALLSSHHDGQLKPLGPRAS